MEDIENMMKCRAIFLYSIGLLCDDVSILEDDQLNNLLHGFLINYLDSNFELFNLIYYLRKDEDGKLYVYEEEEWNDILFKNLECLARHDNKNIIKMYNEIGDNIVSRISELAKLFYEYVLILRDVKFVKIKS